MLQPSLVKYSLEPRSTNPRGGEPDMLGEPPPAGAVDRRGLFGMSVTTELTGVPAQNLRAYEAKGLIEPARTSAGTRRYSEHDIARIGRITALLEAGLNLKGI